MNKEEFFKDEESGSIYKTVEYKDGSMRPFVFQHGSNKWVNVPIGHLAQAQWNGHKISKKEADEAIKRQKQNI